MQIRPFETADRMAVITLWRNCGLVKSWNDPNKDIDRKLHRDPHWFFVGEQNSQVIASMMIGYEGHRGWINYLAVSPDYQRQHFGHQLVNFAEQELLKVNCPKLNLQIRATNSEVIRFYESLGFKVDEAVSMGKRLIADE